MAKCPHCNKPLSREQVKAIWAASNSDMRKTKSGGKNGGRPKRESKG